ncbi:hypothetical protein [uncultured Shewanella sp.]|uniref:hypothetical protein n=1 Tax=uncultured Shewanella sp. TaxID=173975 RepID=UPI002601CE5E|nr:hypothetical protein [uncultured Shewanella sp.]
MFRYLIYGIIAYASWLTYQDISAYIEEQQEQELVQLEVAVEQSDWQYKES